MFSAPGFVVPHSSVFVVCFAMCTVRTVYAEAESLCNEKMWMVHLQELDSSTLSEASTTESTTESDSDDDDIDCETFPERIACVRDLEQLFIGKTSISRSVRAAGNCSSTLKPVYDSDDDESVVSDCESEQSEDDGFPPRSFCITDFSEIL